MVEEENDVNKLEEKKVDVHTGWVKENVMSLYSVITHSAMSLPP
jgi:hypothetical protein